MNTFIFDDLTDIPTILATNRVKRPDKTGVVKEKKDGEGEKAPETEKKGEGVKEEPKKEEKKEKVCFFCKGNEHMTPPATYQDSDNWNVRVFANKFPIVPDHEIVVHSPEHDTDLTELSLEQNVKYVRALLNRVNHYTTKGMEAMVFNNRGGKAGASLMHPHSQIVALQGFPGIIELEKHEALNYYNEHSSCFWCDLIKTERALSTRVIYESQHFLLIVPKASRWSYEIMLLPKKHNPNFEYMNEVEINDFALVLKSALIAYDKMFDRPDRNYWIHTQRYDPYHWHVGFIPHIKVFGGLELGAGIWVSDRATPEDAAEQLGEHVKNEYEGEKVSLV
jgi:UDPglucose--hexose-1-phosphate uridylyltransferase